MSRKRGKKHKAVVEAIPDDILAEGSGPVRRVAADAIATVEDVVTTADIATTDDVVTADDVVATSSVRHDEPAAGSERGDGPGAAEADGPGDRAGRSAGPAADQLGRAAGRRRRRRSDEPRAEPEAVSRERDGDPDVTEAVEAGLAGAAGESEIIAGAEGDGGADGEVDTSPGAEVGLAADASERDSAELDARDGPEGAEDGGDETGEDGDGDGEDGESDGDDGEGDGDDAIVFPTSAANMDATQLKYLVEALIFASDRPLTLPRLRQLTRVGDVRRLEQALAELSADHADRGLILQQVSGGYQFRTRTQFSAWVQQLIAGRPVRLSRAQLETLAIIAYRQPITRPEIDDIRGVDSSQTLKLLIDRMLIRVLGKREEVGRPILYGTTKEFLDFFSLGDLRELPTLREYSELTAESRKVMSDRLGLAPDGSDGMGGMDGMPGRGVGPGGEGGDDGDGPGGNGGGNGHGNGSGNGHGNGGGGAMPGFDDDTSADHEDVTGTASARDLADAVAPLLAAVDDADGEEGTGERGDAGDGFGIDEGADGAIAAARHVEPVAD